MKPDLHDILALTGMVLIAAGFWWIYPPAALIGLGAGLVATGVLRRPAPPADTEGAG